MTKKALPFLAVFFIIVASPAPAWGYGNSTHEYHHIFPQEHFEGRGDSCTAKLREFEHLWVHSSGGFDNDWRNASPGVLTGGEDITAYAKRRAAIAAGSRLISYRLLAYDYSTRSVNLPLGLFACHLDGVSNIIYNVSYICSIPSKFVHFTLECLKRGTGIGNGSRKTYGIVQAGGMFLWMIWSLFLGFILALIMLVVGTVVGAVCHPFETVALLSVSLFHPLTTNLITTVGALLWAVFKPLLNIFFWAL